jgi:hypothetical protein
LAEPLMRENWVKLGSCSKLRCKLVLASRDLIEIADYFAETNVEVGKRFFREFNNKC